jgi:hypothetical protein
VARSSQETAQSGCTGLSGGAPDSVRCARLVLANWLLSGLRRRRTAIIHRTVRWCTGLSGEPTVSRAKRSAEESAHDAWQVLTVVRGTGQCPVRQRLQDCNSRLRQIRKEIRIAQCPVVHRTVRCARRQKARIAFLECTQRLLAALGL